MSYSRDSFSLTELVANHIARYPYLYSSIAAHALVLLLFYYLYSMVWSKDQHYVNSPEQKNLIEHSVHETKIMAMQNNVQELEKIKELLVGSIDNKSQEKSNPLPRKSLEDDPAVNQTSESVLTAAKKLSEEIKSLDALAKAEELAKLLNISVEDASKKIASNELKRKGEEHKNDAVKAVAELKKEAKEILLQRKQHMEQQKSGTKIAIGNPSKQAHGGTKKGNGSGS